MAKKNNLINKSLENAPKADREINRQLVEKYAQYIGDERTASPDFEVTIRGVEKYSRPKFMRRIGAVAAALAVIVGIGGTTMLMQRAGLPDSQMTDESSENRTEPTNEPDSIDTEDYLKNNCDMSTKEGIYTKIRNSYMFFDRASGLYVSGNRYDESIYYATDFTVDLTTAESNVINSMYYRYINVQDIMSGTYPDGDPVTDENGLESRVIYDCDNKKAVTIYNDRTYDYDLDSGEISPRENKPIVCGYLPDGTYGALDSTEPNKGISGSAACYIDPCVYQGLGFMEDMDCWEIMGELGYAGRVCVSVEIYKTVDGNEYQGGMYIDKETGFILQYSLYKNYELYEYMSVFEIAFDEDAPQVEHIDLNGYTRSKRTSTEQTESE